MCARRGELQDLNKFGQGKQPMSHLCENLSVQSRLCALTKGRWLGHSKVKGLHGLLEVHLLHVAGLPAMTGEGGVLTVYQSTDTEGPGSVRTGSTLGAGHAKPWQSWHKWPPEE